MKKLFASVILLSLFMIGCNTNNKSENAGHDSKVKNIVEETVTYSSDTSQFTGYVVYDANQEGKRPAVLIVHEWWGLTDYPRNRARQLAEMGYIAMAVDMYGNEKIGPNPDAAMALATPFYQNPALAKQRLDLAIEKIKSFEQTDASKMAAIGYCFGGYVVLNAAKLGADLDGVVSFHGGLGGASPMAGMKAKVLVAHGEADNFVPPAEVDAFKKSMDSVKADYTFKTYPNATHAFTNKRADEYAKEFQMPISYNAAADSASWNDMKEFFDRIFK